MEKSGPSGVLKWVKNGHFNTSDGNFWEFQADFGNHAKSAKKVGSQLIFYVRNQLNSDSNVRMNSYIFEDGLPGQLISSDFIEAFF